jgi:hypothetical protein
MGHSLTSSISVASSGSEGMSVSVAASTSGIAPVMSSVGGVVTPSPPATATKPEVKVQGTVTPSVTPSYVQASDARSSFVSSIVVGMVVASLLFVFGVML